MAIYIYPVEKTQNVCRDYKVKVNGKEAELNTARVSAVPFNRRWPGHQRGKEQTELINFLSLSMDEEITFEITPERDFENVIIRPQSLGITPEIKNGTIRFTLERPAYFTVEPYGRNNALHIFADPLSSYNIDFNDSNVLYFGAGEHDVGEIKLESNQTLFIDEGAVVYACVKAIDAENIKILGRGILDNSRNHEEILFDYNAENNTVAVKNAKRQHTVQLEYCTNIEIEGITIRESLVYNIRPMGCENLHISNVKIIGCWRYNSDGIDMHNCKNVHIDNCFLRTFDDSICVKGFDCYYSGDVEKAVHEAMYHNGKAYDVFKDVVVENCTIWNDWAKCLEIGAETRAEEISNIVFKNCNIIHVTGSVLDCLNVDYADVHDVTYKNITIEYDDIIPCPSIQKSDEEKYINPDVNYSPKLISVEVAFHPEYSANGVRRGRNHNITFENIHLIGSQKPRMHFKGHDEEHKTKDVIIKDFFWNGKRISEIEEEQFVIGEFTENICIQGSGYEQLDKNTVKATNQLKETNYVRFTNENGKGKRVLFVGNSITLHGKKPEIGWLNEWGMAASSKENDYAHRLMKKISENDPDTAFCICQVSAWESKYKDGRELYNLFENARNFEADIIIMRFVENCPRQDFEKQIFKTEAKSLLQYLNPNGNAEIILTTSFWHHPGDEAIIELAQEEGLPLVTLCDLGDNDEMKAIGKFEHTGVANHPGDLGMQHIADRIFNLLKMFL